MPTQPASVACQIQGRVATITLNRPPLNILYIPMIGELHEALARVQSASDASVLVIAHLGKAFSAGVSIQDHAPDRVGEMLEKFHGMIGLLHSLDIPSIALVDGMALGGDRSLSEGIAAAEQLYLGELMSTEDAREGLNAFLEKRKPVWKHK